MEKKASLLDASEAIDPFSSTNDNGNDDGVTYLYNLTPGTTYYYRVYAKDCNSTFYGNNSGNSSVIQVQELTNLSIINSIISVLIS